MKEETQTLEDVKSHLINEDYESNHCPLLLRINLTAEALGLPEQDFRNHLNTLFKDKFITVEKFSPNLYRIFIRPHSFTPNRPQRQKSFRESYKAIPKRE